jgi:hypothetical protein
VTKKKRSPIRRYFAMAVDNSRADGCGETCGHRHLSIDAAEACAQRLRDRSPCVWYKFKIRTDAGCVDNQQDAET